MNRRVLALLFGCAIIGSVFADGSGDGTGTSGGGGHDNDGEGGFPDGSDRQQRSVNVQVTNSGVHIESELKTSSQRNKFELDFELDEFRLGVQLQAQFGNDDESRNSAFFRWKIGGVVEYTDADAVPGFQQTDNIGNIWNFTKPGFLWSGPTVTTVAGVAVNNFQGVSADGFFTLVGHISGGVFNAGPNNSITITPVATKFDIILNPGTSFYRLSNSRLAIVGWVMSGSQDGARQLDDAGNEVTTTTDVGKRIHFGPAASPSGFFTWDMNPNCTDSNGNPSNCPVIVSPLVDDPKEANDGDSNNVNKRTSHSFDRIQPRSINWDPTLGVGAGATGSGTHDVPSLVALGALTLAALFATLA